MNKNFFIKILSDYQKYIALREIIIKNSRKVLKLAKQAIFNIHREDMLAAEKDLKDAEKHLLFIGKYFVKEKRLNYEGAYKECTEEYVEARLFFEFAVGREIKLAEKFNFSFEDYLGGVSDLTGEMLRKAVQLATAGEYQELDRYHAAMEEIMGELIKFDLTGKLRLKYDAAKRNLRRLEDIKYDIKIKGLK